MLNKERLDQILEPTIEGLGFEFILLEISNNNSSSKGSAILRIYVDKEGGINLDDCYKISKHINRVLDVEEGISGKYSLEVSSPGAERPLVKPKHFQSFIGKKVRIKLNMPIEDEKTGIKQKKVIGYLKNITDDNTIVVSSFETENLDYHIAFENISKANIVPEWS